MSLEILVEERSAESATAAPASRRVHVLNRIAVEELAKYRNPEAVRGGLAKVVAATEIAQHMNVDVNRSRSFQVFRDGVRRLVAGGSGAAEN